MQLLLPGSFHLVNCHFIHLPLLLLLLLMTSFSLKEARGAAENSHTNNSSQLITAAATGPSTSSPPPPSPLQPSPTVAKHPYHGYAWNPTLADDELVVLTRETVPSQQTAPAAARCYYYVLKDGEYLVHCLHLAFRPKLLPDDAVIEMDTWEREDMADYPEVNSTIYCPAARKVYECINEYACEVCSYEQAMAFAGLREEWFSQRYARACSEYPPPTTTEKPLCQVGLVKPARTTAEPTWPPLRPVPPSRTSVYVFFGVLALIVLIFAGITVLMYSKRSEPLALETQLDGKKRGGSGASGAHGAGLVGKSMLLVDYTVKGSKAGDLKSATVRGYGSAAGQKTGDGGGVPGASCFNTRATLKLKDGKVVAKESKGSKAAAEEKKKKKGRSKEAPSKEASKKKKNASKEKAKQNSGGSQQQPPTSSVVSSRSTLKLKNSSSSAPTKSKQAGSSMGKEVKGKDKKKKK